ncbi:uracil-DNA glycosylase family protein [Aminipila sp.]|uniref:uracil-DNA glycosylase family protein n=1 Tax=Aminipila sp. TaxID=2060095 RepID=UPI0028A0A1D8|nr:uracil-DNA glycosylase family protein [Aminipila sp.]
MINETAFYPGGRGLWLYDKTDVFPKILVLGQDFSTEKYYYDFLNKRKKDTDSPTWKNLIKLFNEASINMQNCFFSNVFMGLRKTDSMTGKFPGLKDQEFKKRNIEYLKYQIEIIKPRLIITLGKFAAELLSSAANKGLENWSHFKALRLEENALKYNVIFGEHSCTCLAINHPSMRHLNIKRCKYKDCVGNDAEIMMLKDAVIGSERGIL